MIEKGEREWTSSKQPNPKDELECFRYRKAG
jgi:hypothetical protein